MELPEFAYSIGFWVKFILTFSIFVIIPVWVFTFTDAWGFFDKILLSIAGAVGLIFALNGKTIKYRQGHR